jgi:hypothetical protein
MGEAQRGGMDQAIRARLGGNRSPVDDRVRERLPQEFPVLTSHVRQAGLGPEPMAAQRGGALANLSHHAPSRAGDSAPSFADSPASVSETTTCRAVGVGRNSAV